MNCFKCGRPGHISRECHIAEDLAIPAPDGEKLRAQHARCPGCQALIYRWDAGQPCETHRTVTGWHEYYHSPQFVADVAQRQAEAGARRSDFRRAADLPERSATELRSIASQQVRESRAGRLAILETISRDNPQALDHSL